MKKFLIIITIILIFLASLAAILIKNVPILPPKDYGVTFSSFYAEKFEGVDWQKGYLAILDDLQIKKLRLPVYWSEVEKTEGIYDFSRVDWQVEEAGERDVEIILAVGKKLPRWPECHIPDWAQNLSEEKQNEILLRYIEVVVNKYKNKNVIKIWQIENEPFLPFGECSIISAKQLNKEIELVRSLDSRPIMITDSGELSFWIPAAKRADIFGSTMYRQVRSEELNLSFTYPIPASFFRFKRSLTNIFVGDKPMIVVELQAEPWMEKMSYETTPEEQFVIFGPSELKNTLEYASRSGFDTFYLWGVEWWYWLKEVKNKPEMWNIAKEAIQLVQ